MSKFFLTNNKEIAQRIKETILNSDFKLCAEIEQDCLYAYSTKKMQIDNTNYYKDGSNFVIATGTLLFEKQQNLKKIYDSLLSVNKIRENSIGQYAITICKKDDILVFSDPVAAYNIYYFNHNNTFVISNSLYDLAYVIRERITVNKLNLIEQVTESAILGGETYFNEIYRLDGEHAIHIKKGEFELISNGTLFKPFHEDSSFSNSYKTLAERIKDNAKIIYHAFGDPDICMTGGLDARTSLAAYLAIGSKPHLNYGVGNSALTNTFNDDFAIDCKLHDKFKLRLNKQDWTTPDPMDKYWDLYLKKYGFFYIIYGASNKIFESFENMSQNISTFGYGGELYRNLPWIENNKKQFFSVEDFYEEYYKHKADNYCIEDVSGYKNHITNKLTRICNKYGLNPQKIRIEDNFLFLLEYRKVADTVVMNFLNLFKYSNLILMEYNCLSCPRPSVDYLRNSKFQLYVIEELYPKVLDIPVFSHCKHVVFNRKKMCLEHPVSIRSKIKKVIPSYIVSLVKRHALGANNNGKKESKSNSKSDINASIKLKLKYYYEKEKLPLGLQFNFEHDIRKPNYYFMIKKIIETLKPTQ